jgi:hypothetical protein
VPNEARLTALVVQGLEGLMDRYDTAMADGHIDPQEDRDIREEKFALYALAMDADEGVGLAVTMLRRGPDSVSLKRRMVERGIRVAKQQEAAEKIVAFPSGNGPRTA